MDLYIKKAKRTIADKFSITDEKGGAVYQAKGQLISVGNKLTLCDAGGAELATIHEKKIALRKKYVIETKGKQVEVLRKDTPKGPEFHIKEFGWEAKGDFDRDNFRIMKGLQTVAHVTPKLMSIGDMVKVDIANPTDAVIVLAMVLVCQLEMA